MGKRSTCNKDCEFEHEFCGFIGVSTMNKMDAFATYMSSTLSDTAHGFRITGFCTTGSYGLLLNAETDKGEACMVKVFNLSGEDSSDMYGQDWYSIEEPEFWVFVHSLERLQEKASGLVPTAITAYTRALPSGNMVGVQVMSNSGARTVFRCFQECKSQKARHALLLAWGKLIACFHDRGFVHGDLHSGNGAVKNANCRVDGGVKLLDTDHIIAAQDISAEEFALCKLYDVQSAASDVQENSPGKSADVQIFLQGYLGRTVPASEATSMYLVGDDALMVAREVYDKVRVCAAAEP